VLDASVALFQEARYLLAEETGIRGLIQCNSVLAAREVRGVSLA
jgi:hypothetical protein